MLAEYLAALTVKLLFAIAGQDKAPGLVSDEAKRRAQAQADAIAAGRRIRGQ